MRRRVGEDAWQRMKQADAAKAKERTSQKTPLTEHPRTTDARRNESKRYTFRCV